MFEQLGEVIVRSCNSDRATKGYNTKLASGNPDLQQEALNSAYLDGFFDHFAGSVKEASMIGEYMVASAFGTQLGLEVLMMAKDSIEEAKRVN